MSVDDCAYIHERGGDFVKRMVTSNAIPFGLSSSVAKFPSYYWHLLLGFFFAAMGLFMIFFLWHRFRGLKFRKYILLSLTGLATALALDFAEGIDRFVEIIEISTGMTERSVIHMLRLVEESLEILCIIGLFYAFLKYLSFLWKGRTITFTE